MKNYKELSLAAHQKWRGKIEMKPRVPVETRDDLSYRMWWQCRFRRWHDNRGKERYPNHISRC